ncbi:DEAD-box ATP-dependent RNA helicase 58 chloroplastic-like, partial [Trifolium medium]|nr:DEAD-box ATP-dependent RNA helicase 58 chloroplastic-like [Trifolium medium]
MEEVGYVMPTEVQKQALPHLFSGCDCILHAQTEGLLDREKAHFLTKTVSVSPSMKCQRLSAKSIFDDKVAKVVRILAAKPSGVEGEQRSCTIMALLDGETLIRHKSWFK